MNIQVGHIFRKGIVTGKSFDAKHWIVEVEINGQRIETILDPEYAPRYMDIKKNILKRGKIENIVVIKHQGRKLFVAKENYLEVLIRFYYIKKEMKTLQNRLWETDLPFDLTDNNNFYYPDINKWSVWHERWKNECTEQFAQNFTIEESSYDTNQKQLNVYVLKGENYVLPVFGYRDLCFLEGKPFFYPSIIKDSRFVERCVYKTDKNDISHNKKFMAKIESKNILKDVSIFLHGFTYPAKWHYGIWKHVLALSPDANKEEKLLWKNITENSPPIPSDLFNRCKVCIQNNKGITCDEIYCIKKSFFRDVHPEIKLLCQKYMKEMVTSLESNETNVIRVYNGPYENCKRITLVYKYQKAGIYHWTVFYGICHNWNDNNHKPVFHLNPLTMYKDSKELTYKVENNNSNRAIFEGFLKEVKRC